MLTHRTTQRQPAPLTPSSAPGIKVLDSSAGTADDLDAGGARITIATQPAKDVD